MDRPPTPLFRQAAIDASTGSLDDAALSTHWRGVAVFTAIAFALIAALIAFVTTVEYSPVQRVPAFVATGSDGLVMKLHVARSAVASTRPGVEIRVAFRAYPQERFGLFPARIESVAEVPAMAGEVPQWSVGSAPMRVAIATLPGELRSSDGEVLPLEPGMLADALVPIGKRSILAWLLDPIRRGFDDSFGRSPPISSAAPRR